MVHVAVNKYDFETIHILEYAFGEGGGGHQKAYAVYAFINVDNCERPLMIYHSDLFYFWSVDTCFHVSYHNVYTSLQVADGVVCVNYLACS